ncbi:MAG: hypothetical protein CVU57_22605 [Deltaproteobacteria bacterium HGW-Deltaproteobacteria-15]|nr:MAG: hypothetical protein CVU57_22605 [Deltaproteobacteria bacterium HGW-Deltaproteobacteria-15]
MHSAKTASPLPWREGTKGRGELLPFAKGGREGFLQYSSQNAWQRKPKRGIEVFSHKIEKTESR